MIVFILVLISSFVILFIAAYLFAGYDTHIFMVKLYSIEWGYSNFDVFMNEYNKRTWERKITFPYSHFSDVYTDTRIHASIIQFDGKGMILDFWSYIKFLFWLNRNKLNRNSKPHVIWS